MEADYDPEQGDAADIIGGEVSEIEEFAVAHVKRN
jgi:hypothetical protein